MPYKTFNNWLFDGNIKSSIPEELLKSTSPISHKYVIGLFQNYDELNYYLNQTVNNESLWYIEKDELFLFIKKLVHTFKVYRGRTFFRSWPKQSKLRNKLEVKFPELKKYEIDLLAKLIDKRDDKDSIYASLGLKKEKKKKIRKKKEKKINLKNFLAENFSVISDLKV